MCYNTCKRARNRSPRMMKKMMNPAPLKRVRSLVIRKVIKTDNPQVEVRIYCDNEAYIYHVYSQTRYEIKTEDIEMAIEMVNEDYA